MVWRCTMCGHQNLGRHTVCQGCGDAKDASEKYEMPGNTAAAPTVMDPALLRIARGGANWRCHYCRSDQRWPDGSCRQCGAPAADALAPTPAPTRMPDLRRSQRLLALGAAGIATLALLICGGTTLYSKTHVGAAMQRAGAERLALPFEDVRGKVHSVTWHHRIDVERYQKVPKEGFEETRPTAAVDIRPAGKRFHHNETVQVGSHTEYYTVTEPDGFNTETYSEQESCGQDCTSAPQTCREVCTPNGNGFATCRTSCSGGGQRCTTRYCTVTKTRQVPRTKQVQKSREVPDYEQRAVNQTWYTWNLWEWTPARSLEKHGTGTATGWPADDEVALGKKLKTDEEERATRVASYAVVVNTNTGPREVPLKEESELVQYSAGKAVVLRVWPSGRTDVL